ncbi:MAG: DMT family transporter [Anaerolineales bacterium]
MRAKIWGVFSLLGLVWGSSFLWIKLALREVPPFTLVGYQILFGLAGMALVLLVLRPRLPQVKKQWLILLLLGLTDTALPFALISWGEQSIDSAMASILNSTVPLFTLVIAHFALSDERITWKRGLGLLIGLAGVRVLVGGDLDLGAIGRQLSGEAAVLAAAVLYAGSAVLARKTLQGIPFTIQAAVPLISGGIAIWIAAAGLEAPLVLPQQPLTWVALAWLGLLGSCMAYIFYFYLLNAIGPTRLTMVTYVFPVVAVVLGVLFLQEPLSWRLMAGGTLVLSGIIIVNRVPKGGEASSSLEEGPQDLETALEG